MFCKEVGLTSQVDFQIVTALCLTEAPSYQHQFENHSQQSGFSGFDNIGIIFIIVIKGQISMSSQNYRICSALTQLWSGGKIKQDSQIDLETFLMKFTKSKG